MFRRAVALVVLAAAGLGGCATVAVTQAPAAEPAAATTAPTTRPSTQVADADRVPLDLRRTTFVVADTERSLAFYRDALGMVVTYDRMIRNPRNAATDEESELARRLVFLRANDTYIGVLGLLEYTKPVREPDPQDPKPFQPGDVVLVFNVEDVDAAYAAAMAVDGVASVTVPQDVTYPAYGDAPPIRVRVSTVLDPDGHAIELNQLLDDLR